MEQVKVEVLDAIVDGHRQGEQIEIDQKTANHLAAIGYVKILEAPKAAPKKPAAKKETPKK